MDSEVADEIRGIKTRLDSVESWMDGFKTQMLNAVNEIQANTALTEQTQGRTEEIYEFLAPARNFFRALGGMADLGLRAGRICVAVIEFLGRLAKPLFWLIAIGAASFAYFKTGHWDMPQWWDWFIR